MQLALFIKRGPVICFCGLTFYHSVYFEHLSVPEHTSLPHSSIRGFLSVLGVVYLPSPLLMDIGVISSVWLAITALPETLCTYPAPCSSVTEASKWNSWVPFRCIDT